MIANKLLISMVLLTHPDPLVEVEDPAALHGWLAPTMQQVAVFWEIMDKREVRHILRDPRFFEEDLKQLRERCEELAAAPRIAECRRFPKRELSSAFLADNQSYRHDLTQRLLFDHLNSEEIRAALQEAEQLRRIWMHVRDARCKYYYITVRRRALQDLRAAIGVQAFYRGELPPPLPVWRIPRID